MTNFRFTVAAAILALSSAGFAQKPPAAQVPSAQGPKPITRSAYLGNVEARFAIIDKNHDGSVDAGEMAAEQQRELQLAKNALAQQLQARFKQLDTNKDGQLSLAEFMAAAPPIRTNETPQQLLQKLDANHDGKVSADEFKAPDLAKFDRIDTNHDGVVSVQEQQAAAAAARK